MNNDGLNKLVHLPFISKIYTSIFLVMSTNDRLSCPLIEVNKEELVLMNKLRDVSKAGNIVIEEFINDLKEMGLNIRTIQEYGSDLKHFISWHEYKGLIKCNKENEIEFNKISNSEILSYLQSMKNIDLKATTINRRTYSIKKFFDWLYKNNKISRDPAKNLKIVPIKTIKPRIINIDEENKLIEMVKKSGSIRDQAILKLLIYTGIRITELCELKIADIKINSKEKVVVVGSEKKRNVKLNIQTKNILEKYLSINKIQNDYLFTSEKTRGKLTQRAIRHIVKKYIDLAKLKGLSAHSLRHNYAYKISQKSSINEVADIMGHNSINTALKYRNKENL